jgi:hypothetical protein
MHPKFYDLELYLLTDLIDETVELDEIQDNITTVDEGEDDEVLVELEVQS